MVARPESERLIVGWREWISLPGLGVPLLKAKVDTGAHSSALHAFDVEEFERSGARWIRFTVHPWQADVATTIRSECELLGQRSIRSSHGHLQVRRLVRTELQVGRSRFPIELTLTNRDEMGFRMLLGRSALRSRFVIDPSRSYVQRRPRGLLPAAAVGTVLGLPAAPQLPL
ncbi:MAG: ATP-dependent zinc protease [Planctomycetes bacterium]|nr:ATP-dependent zinc protease [Planctomycetota bacterium]